MKIKPLSLFLSLYVLGLAQLHFSQAQNEPKDFLHPQNAARAEVGVEPLKWDKTLEEYAKKYAELRSKDCELIHSDGPYGENIFWGEGEGYIDAAESVKLWVDEKSAYDYNSNSCINGKECLHYTQVVWKDSVHLGCARVKCSSDDAVFITCNYDPPLPRQLHWSKTLLDFEYCKILIE